MTSCIVKKSFIFASAFILYFHQRTCVIPHVSNFIHPFKNNFEVGFESFFSFYANHTQIVIAVLSLKKSKFFKKFTDGFFKHKTKKCFLVRDSNFDYQYGIVMWCNSVIRYHIEIDGYYFCHFILKYFYLSVLVFKSKIYNQSCKNYSIYIFFLIVLE